MRAATAVGCDPTAVSHAINGTGRCPEERAKALLVWLEEDKKSTGFARTVDYSVPAQRSRAQDLIEALSTAALPRISPRGCARRKAPANPRSAVTAPLADAHCGMVQHRPAVEVDYDPVIVARYLAYLTNQICNYKRMHRAEHELIVPILGDMCHGELQHVLFSSVSLAHQQVAMLYYLSQMIAELAAEFRNVRVYWLHDNHMRNTIRSPKRIQTAKEESHGMIIAAALKLACRPLPNVEIHVQPGAFATWKTFDHWTGATHGDSDMVLRGPKKARALTVIDDAVAKLNASRRLGVEVSTFLCAHFHTGVLAPYGSTTIMVVPPIAPRNAYDYSQGYDGRSGAWLYHTTPEHALGHTFPLQIDPSVGDDAGWDTLIKPIHGLEEVDTYFGGNT